MNTSQNNIELGDIGLNIIHKDIKNVHLSVHPPHGRVTISAPRQMDMEAVRLFSISKLGWIRKQQQKFKNQKRETAREYVTRESHYYLGQRYLLRVIEQNAAPRVVLKHGTIELYIRKGTSSRRREEALHSWYRYQLRELVLPYISRLEKKLNVTVA